MQLPEALIAAATGQAKNTISLVIGAGTSLEAPTSLDTTSEYAKSAHALLVGAGIIEPDDCADPADLTCVADAVWKRTERQEALVARLPSVDFTNAQSNIGHRTAAALLREQVLGAVLTLNFDRAQAHALSQVGAGGSVVVIAGPEQHANYGGNCVIHLHRDATAPPDRWILRTQQLTEDWKDHWEELMTTCVAARPVVVFVGLGSAAAVVTESVRRIRSVVQNAVFEVGPGEAGKSPFSAALQVTPETHVRAGWCEFMTELGRVVAGVQLQALRRAFAHLVASRLGDENPAMLLAQLGECDLLGLGSIRAGWLLSESEYETADGVTLEHFADLLHALTVLQRTSGWTPQVQVSDGSVEFVDAIRTRLSIFPVSGQGRRRAAVEELARSSRRFGQRRRRERVLVLVTATVGPSPTLPVDLVAEPVPEDITTAEQSLAFAEVDDLRSNPSLWSRDE